MSPIVSNTRPQRYTASAPAGAKDSSSWREPWDQVVNKIEQPRQGRKKFDLEHLSPLPGLLACVARLIPRLTPWATNMPPLTGLSITRAYVELRFTSTRFELNPIDHLSALRAFVFNVRRALKRDAVVVSRPVPVDGQADQDQAESDERLDGRRHERVD